MKHFYTSILLLASLPLFSQSHDLSPLFGQGGTLRLDTWSGSDVGSVHTLTNDGKLIVAGTGYWNQPNSFRVPMVVLDTACGVLDTSFSQDGMANIYFEQRTICHGLTTQPDGKIIGAGVNATSNGGSQHKPVVFRLKADGTSDTTFNGTGFNKSPFDGVSSGGFYNVFLLPDGRITCVGVSTTNINGGSPGMGAQRFMPDGSLDTTFGQGGVTIIPIAGSQVYTGWSRGSGIIQPDGKVVVGALVSIGSDYTILMARFNTDGSPDVSFGNGGLKNTGVVANAWPHDTNFGMELMPDGRILMSCAESSTGFLMTRVLPNGDVDMSYGTNGVSVVEPTVDSRGYAMELLPDGCTLQFGAMNWNNGPPCVVKRDMNGAVDSTFGTNGVQQVATLAGTTFEKFWGGLALTSGRIIAYGEGQSSTMLIARITTDPQSEHFVDLGGDVTICDGDSVQLNAGPGQSWSWSDGSSDQTLFVSTPLFVQVTVTDANGCIDSDQVQVSVSPGPPVPVITANGVDLSTTAVGALQWYLDGVAIPGADQSAHTVLSNGDYTVSVTDTSGCSSLSTITTVTDVGIDEFGPEHFSVFPNPTSRSFMIDLPSSVTIERITLIDAVGRHTTLVTDSQRRHVDIRNLAPGHYTLLIHLENDRRISKPIMIR